MTVFMFRIWSFLQDMLAKLSGRPTPLITHALWEKPPELEHPSAAGAGLAPTLQPLHQQHARWCQQVPTTFNRLVSALFEDLEIAASE